MAQLAYNHQGELVDLVAPVRMLDASQEGSIGYIGIVPEQRGRGYIHDLPAKGMAVLRSAGIKRIYSEADSRNTAMLRAFERAGHQPAGTVWLYRSKL